jgi:nucleoid-associated protein YgaU
MAAVRHGGTTLVAGSLLASSTLVGLAWPRGTRLGDLWTTLASQPPQQSLPLLLALAVFALSAWFSLVLTLALVARLPGAAGRLGSAGLRRLAPAVLRHALEVAVGATAVLAVTGGAAQAAPPVQRVAVAQQAAVPALAGLDRPAASARTVPASGAPAAPVLSLDRPADAGRGLGLVSTVPTRDHTAAPATVTVRPGDSLWRIAERSLPRGSGVQAVERAWHRWYEANRVVVGPDPDLLQPGQQLIAPQP